MGMDFSVTKSASTALFSKGANSITNQAQQESQRVRSSYESMGKKVGTLSSSLNNIKTSPEKLGKKAQAQADAGNQAATRGVDRIVNVLPISVNSLA